MIFWLNNVKDKDLKEVGSKAFNLSKLFKSALKIPIGFVVPSSTYFSFIRNLKIGEILDGLDVDDSENLKFAARKIQLLIMKSEFSNDDIEDAYDTLSADDLSTSYDPFVSIRISPASNDPSLSALLDESFTNISGTEDLIKHVKACYCSIFTAKNIYYLKKNNFNWQNIALPVIVQVMVDAECSGFAYTKNPSDDADEVVIESVFGLPKGLESSVPDVYIVDKSSNDIKDVLVGEKTLMFYRDSNSGKTLSKEVTDGKMKEQVLEERFIDEVARIAKRVENFLLKPQKVEWVFDGKGFFVIGSSPMS